MGFYILEQLEAEESEAHLFSPLAEEEAERAVLRAEKILEGRRKVNGIIIDPHGAEELDDVIWIEKKTTRRIYHTNLDSRHEHHHASW